MNDWGRNKAELIEELNQLRQQVRELQELVAEASDEDDLVEANPGHPSLPCRVLLVEDCPDTQRLLLAMLSSVGAQVTLAGNGFIAYDLAMSAEACGKPFDIILMDMDMPFMDGKRATRRLREDKCTMPIIALTGHTGQYSREDCLEAGCTEYLPKPIRRETLLDTMARYVARPVRKNEVCGILSRR